jgi:hypothetical protein
MRLEYLQVEELLASVRAPLLHGTGYLRRSDIIVVTNIRIATHALLLLLLSSSSFALALQSSAGYGPLVHEVSGSHTTTRHSR